jgi:tetratricopeptide (TPR) repeat protein
MRWLIALLTVVILALPLRAQETPSTVPTAEQLDQFFGQLKSVEGGAQVLTAERKIWQLWMEGGSPSQNNTLQQATTLMEIGALAESEAILNQLITSTQSFSEAYNKRATLYYLMGRYQQSLDDIALTLELEPRHFGALSGKGMVLQRMGRNGEALAAYREALLVNPHMVGARLAIKQLEQVVPDL